LIAVAAVAVSLLGGFSIIYRRLRQRMHRASRPSIPSGEPRMPPPAQVVSAGEREAAWSAGAAAALLTQVRADADRLRRRLDASEREALLLEASADDVRDTLASADAEIAALRSQVEAAEQQLAHLEIERAASATATPPEPLDDDRIERLEAELAKLRNAVATHAAAERDLRHRLEVAEKHGSRTDHLLLEDELAAATARIAELEAALAAIPMPEADVETGHLRHQIAELTLRLGVDERSQASLRVELAAARSEADRMRRSIEEVREEADRRVAAAAAEVARQTARAVEFERAARETDRDAARLVVRDAQVADLEARLAALSAARDSELRRLNDKIGSMERLYVEVEARERRIVQLEDEVKAIAEARDDAVSSLARAERDLIAVQGAHGEALATLDHLEELQAELTEARTRVVELERHDEAAALMGELERVKGTLATERERSARMQRRLSLEASEQPKIEAATRSYAEWDRLLRERMATAVDSATAPLLERIARLRVVVEEKELLITRFTSRPEKSGPDDLTLIRGIGPKIRDILHGMGITEFRRIAQFTDQDVELVGAALPVYGRRILDDRWIEQARELGG
jgi:predicted flap endonuclease-1-like 5' DNA nuclease